MRTFCAAAELYIVEILISVAKKALHYPVGGFDGGNPRRNIK
jgi:hypothetical protein